MEKINNKKVIINVSDLSKSFNNNIVLKNINFQLLEGESLAIIGASGSGKSVLLKNIIGILQPDKGSIVINDTEIVNLPRNLKEKLLLDLGITFQHGALFDSLKNWENIIFKTANKASCGTSTLPIVRILFLPFFCFCNNLFFLVTSPP